MIHKIKRVLSPILIVIIIDCLYGCEGNQIIILPNEPEKLYVVAIIDADDTNRTVLFKKSYQLEYPAEEKDSIRELSFTLSSNDSNLFEYSHIRSLRNNIPVAIPGNINFETGKKYFLQAKEKTTEGISSQIIVPSLPPDFTIDSMEKIVYINNSYPQWANPVMKARLHISIKNIDTDISYFTFFIEGNLNTTSSSKNFVSYLVLSSEIPTFQEYIPGYSTRFWNFITPFGVVDTYSVSFFKVNKRNNEVVNISIGMEMGGAEIYDYKKPVKIKLLLIPEELYNFEKSLYTYSNARHDPFSEPVYLDSNIKDGYGIFAICRSKEVMISLPWQ